LTRAEIASISLSIKSLCNRLQIPLWAHQHLQPTLPPSPSPSPFHLTPQSINPIHTTTTMSEKNNITNSHTPSDDPSAMKALDTDALALAQMGYTPTLKRNYTWFSLLGVGFSLTNSWWGISAALITGINSGGPVQIVYGLIFFALLSTYVLVPHSQFMIHTSHTLFRVAGNSWGVRNVLPIYFLLPRSSSIRAKLTSKRCSCVGISLSELASALPNAGGQYYWASELAPRRWARGSSYLTGWFAWAGSLFTSASVALGTSAAAVVGLPLANLLSPLYCFVHLVPGEMANEGLLRILVPGLAIHQRKAQR